VSTLVPNYAKLCKISNTLKNGENLNRHTKHGHPAFGQHFRGDHASNRNGAKSRKRILSFYCGHAFADPGKKSRTITTEYICYCCHLARFRPRYRQNRFLSSERYASSHRTDLVFELFFSVSAPYPCPFL